MSVDGAALYIVGSSPTLLFSRRRPDLRKRQVIADLTRNGAVVGREVVKIAGPALSAANVQILKRDDEVTPARRHSPDMTRRETLLRVAVDVTPRLFSDALTRVLEHHQVQVVTLSSGDRSWDDRLDVVVTSANSRGHLPADVLVVEVRPGAGSSNTTHTSPALSDENVVRSLDDLVAVIRHFAGPVEPTLAGSADLPV